MERTQIGAGELRLLICGDFAPPRRAWPLLGQGRLEQIAPEHAPIFTSADGVILNLEAPLLGSGTATAKSGPSLCLPRELVTALQVLKVSAVGLANNHIMDLGPGGLSHTQRELEAAGIAVCGAGHNLEAASRPLFLDRAGCRIGLLAAGAHEFGVARPDRPGMNPLDPVRLLPALQELRSACDLCLVLLHAGSESHPWPAPWLQEYCRLLSRLGADLVVCQHSHIVGCGERHGRGQIVYGQGNFLMDLDSPTPRHYREGLLLELVRRPGEEPELRLHPIGQGNDGSLQPLDPVRGDALLAGYQKRSAQLQDPAAVRAAWLEFCRHRSRGYLAQLGTANRLLLKLMTSLGTHWPLSRRRRLLLQNLIRCQDHREALLAILEEDL